MATFKDKYPKICDAICPICKRTCMFKMEKHTDEDGNWTAHICGPHWWVKFKTNGHTQEIYGHTVTP